MIRPSRLPKLLLVPALLALGLIVAVQAVVAVPAPDFTYSVDPAQPATGCKTLNFTSTSGDTQDPEGDVEAVRWDLDNDGDFSDATGPTASRTFAEPGSYTVGIEATDTDAEPDVTLSTTGPVEVPNADPTATVGGATTATTGQAVDFTATVADPDGSLSTPAWDVDGNGFNDGTGAGLRHTFPAGTAGTTQTIRVRVVDNCGSEAIGTRSVTVSAPNVAPVPSFTVKVGGADVTTVNPGVPVTFASTSTDANGDPLTVAWALDGDHAFNDGATTSVTKPAYPVFPAPQVVRVWLRVSDGEAPPVETFVDLRINKAPRAAFSVSPALPLIGAPVTFDATDGSFDYESQNGIASYEWDFDYSGSPASFDADSDDEDGIVTHVFEDPGAHQVGLRVTDVDGGATTIGRAVEVQATQPRPSFRHSPAYPLPGQPVTLTSTSTPSAPGVRSLVSTQWDLNYNPLAAFGADRPGASIVTSFATPGPHVVAVRVTETGGGSAIKEGTVVVNAPPRAAFTVSPAKAVEGREVTFASTSSDPDGPIVKHEWDLDNNGTFERTGAVVSTTQLKKGARSIRLRVTDSRAATATSAQGVNVAAKPLKPPVDIKRRIGFARRTWGVELVALIVKVPSRTTVTAKCTGRGCPRATFKKRTRKKGAWLRFSKLKGSVRAGGKITLVAKRTGHVSTYDTYLIRGGLRAPLLRERCRWGGGKPKRCP